MGRGHARRALFQLCSIAERYGILNPFSPVGESPTCVPFCEGAADRSQIDSGHRTVLHLNGFLQSKDDDLMTRDALVIYLGTADPAHRQGPWRTLTFTLALSFLDSSTHMDTNALVRYPAQHLVASPCISLHLRISLHLLASPLIS